MRLLEFQGKRLLSMNGIVVPASTLRIAPEDLEELQYPVVLKAQVPFGGRGKAGMIRHASSPEQAIAAVSELKGLDIEGYHAFPILVESKVSFTRELYLAALIDKATNLPMVMAGAVGGIDIESISKKEPGTIIRVHVDPCIGLAGYSVRKLARRLSMEERSDEIRNVVERMLELFESCNASLVEINPLAVTDDALVALDAKIVLDDRAANSHPELFNRAEKEQEECGVLPSTGRKKLARQTGLVYVDLGGDIAMISDGAGTGLLTLDLIRDAGGQPACFCELGAKADSQGIQHALDIVLSDPPPRALVISLIGGLTRMDELADGIAASLTSRESSTPIAVRMCGTREEEGRAILRRVGIETHEDLETVVRVAVEGAEGIDGDSRR